MKLFEQPPPLHLFCLNFAYKHAYFAIEHKNTASSLFELIFQPNKEYESFLHHNPPFCFYLIQKIYHLCKFSGSTSTWNQYDFLWCLNALLIFHEWSKETASFEIKVCLLY